ncbi:hypothetical protein G7Y89_g2446 [Cudoniella acicularis]|uniref:N-acetyltransferase domain-containing protein n=1 Tax=Cudoniella acicularis TaxID=354080 RepID=A0A8H4RV30_9HELO|nr:hypothetical protein G7Y89_g2446 [Cudoniella acicularis]
MSFQLIEVKTDEQFEKMMPGFWAGYTHPRNALMELMYPIKGGGPSALAEAMEDCKTRLLSSWRANPLAHYIQILDGGNNNAVVGSAMWIICDSEHNPFSKKSEEKPEDGVVWWPEGSDIRKFTNRAIEEATVLKVKRQTRPHLWLGMCYTDPVYRRQGAATMLMEWGVKKADELDLECFLDSTPIGVPLYKNFGFLAIDDTSLDMTITNPSDEWKEWEKKILPYQWFQQPCEADDRSLHLTLSNILLQTVFIWCEKQDRYPSTTATSTAPPLHKNQDQASNLTISECSTQLEILLLQLFKWHPNQRLPALLVAQHPWLHTSTSVNESECAAADLDVSQWCVVKHDGNCDGDTIWGYARGRDLIGAGAIFDDF